MIRKVEEPDMVLTDTEYKNDKLSFILRKNTILINCQIDNTGNEWEIPIKKFKDMLLSIRR